jgi:ubiquinone/menaquinone biosynthesis C-methylase UbiE
MDNTKLAEEHYDRYLDPYEYWSGKNGGGYHFGFPKKFREIFDNEKMTKNMSELVIEKSKLDYDSPQIILDAGCGAGYLGRILAKKFKHKDFKIYGITISKKQLELGNQLNGKDAFKNNLFLSLDNFEQTPFENDYFDAVYFVDSICHGSGKNKSKALSEAFRILKPGGAVVITDGFLAKEENDIYFWGKYLSRKVRHIFGVEEWANKNLFFQEMARIGFRDLKAEDYSYRIAPSVMHALFFKFPGSIVLFFRGKAKFFQIKYSFLVGFFAPLLGIHPSFKYQIVTAKK